MEKPSRRRRPLLGPLPFLYPRLTRFSLSHPHRVRLRMGKRGRQIRRSTHRGSSSPPPLDLLNIPDEFKSLERDRLRPCDLETTDPSALQQYDAYLEWFYRSHSAPAPVASLADAASMCLDKEKSMKSLWWPVDPYSVVRANPAGIFIGVSMRRTVIEAKGELERPFGIDAAKCIAKEAELISEWIKRGHHNFANDEYSLCHSIRALAANLFVSGHKWSVHIAAALLGIRKEAEWLIENKKCNPESISTSMKIRQFAVRYVRKKLSECEPYVIPMPTWSDDESDDESDDDVAENLAY